MNILNPLKRKEWPEPEVAPALPVPEMAQVQGISESSQAVIQTFLSDGGNLFPFTILARETAMGFPAFARSVTLISGLLSLLVTKGSLHVFDIYTKRRIKTRRAQEALYLLAESPDGERPASQFIEDLMADYLMEGNSLAVPNTFNDRVLSLRRGIASKTERMARMVGTLSIPMEDGSTVVRARRDVVLSRWPRSYAADGILIGGTSRQDFAPSNIDILRNSLHIGLASDEFIQEFFRSVRGKRHVNFAVTPNKYLQPTQMAQLQKEVARQAQTGGPFVFGDSNLTKLTEKAADADSDTLRKMQIRQVANYFGVPAILVGEEVTSWGSGIEELSKGFVRYGLSIHLSRFLDPFSFSMLPRNQKFGVDHSDMIAASIESLTKLATVAGGDMQRAPFMSQDQMRGLFGMAPDDSLPKTPYKPPAGVRPPAPAPTPNAEEEEEDA